MATFRDMNTYRRAIRTRMNNMIRAAKNNGAKASAYFEGQLKQTAAYRTGKLARSVRRRKLKNGWSVLAGYSNGNFNVGRYINQEITSYGRIYPKGVRNPTATVYPWFDKNKEKTIRRYRAGYKKVRMKLRG